MWIHTFDIVNILHKYVYIISVTDTQNVWQHYDFIFNLVCQGFE